MLVLEKLMSAIKDIKIPNRTSFGHWDMETPDPKNDWSKGDIVLAAEFTAQVINYLQV